MRTQLTSALSIDCAAGTLDTDLYTFKMARAIEESMHETQRNKACIAPAEQTRRSRDVRRPCGWSACTSGLIIPNESSQQTRETSSYLVWNFDLIIPKLCNTELGGTGTLVLQPDTATDKPRQKEYQLSDGVAGALM